MRILFFGTPLFAVPPLEGLIKSNHTVVGVVTQPDRPKGRSLKISESPVKQAASQEGIRVFQPFSLNSEVLIKELKQLRADLFIVVSYGKMLPKTLLEIPRFYCLNIHASLLPRYRGAAPISAVIQNRDPKTGVTIIRMTEKMDAGSSLMQKEIAIDSKEDGTSLSEKLSHLGADTLLSGLRLVQTQQAVFTPQDESQATYTKRLKKEDGKIVWSCSAEEIESLIRGMIPWPSAFTLYQKRRLQIWKAGIIQRPAYGRHGQILKVDYSQGVIEVSTGKNILLIQEVQPESRKRMSAGEFAKGHHLRGGDLLGE